MEKSPSSKRKTVFLLFPPLLECVCDQLPTHTFSDSLRCKHCLQNFPPLRKKKLFLQRSHSLLRMCAAQNKFPRFSFQFDWIYPGIFATFMLWIFHQKHWKDFSAHKNYWKFSHVKARKVAQSERTEAHNYNLIYFFSLDFFGWDNIKSSRKMKKILTEENKNAHWNALVWEFLVQTKTFYREGKFSLQSSISTKSPMNKTSSLIRRFFCLFSAAHTSLNIIHIITWAVCNLMTHPSSRFLLSSFSLNKKTTGNKTFLDFRSKQWRHEKLNFLMMLIFSDFSCVIEKATSMKKRKRDFNL